MKPLFTFLMFIKCHCVSLTNESMNQWIQQSIILKRLEKSCSNFGGQFCFLIAVYSQCIILKSCWRSKEQCGISGLFISFDSGTHIKTKHLVLRLWFFCYSQPMHVWRGKQIYRNKKYSSSLSPFWTFLEQLQHQSVLHVCGKNF